jgi:hypothetical protein
MQMLFDTVDLVMLLKNLFAGHIRYDIAKGRSQSIGKATGKRDEDWTKPAAIKRLDCSGFVQYVIHETTRQYWKIPTGSVKQKDWLVANKFLNYQQKGESIKIPYKRESPKCDNLVRIAFKQTIPGKAKTKTSAEVEKKVGHVWLVINGKTYESTATGGKTIGPKSFPWSKRTNAVDYFFLLGRAPNFRINQLGYNF